MQQRQNTQAGIHASWECKIKIQRKKIMWRMDKFSTPAQQILFSNISFPLKNCSADFANTMGYISRIMYSSCKLWSQLSIQFYFPDRKKDYYTVPTQCWRDIDKFWLSHFKLRGGNYIWKASLNETNGILIVIMVSQLHMHVYISNPHNIFEHYGFHCILQKFIYLIPNLPYLRMWLYLLMESLQR